jgi:hypothetical protein
MYDREYLKTAIPDATAETVDTSGQATVGERQQFSDDFNRVLSVLRIEYRFGTDKLDEAEVNEAVSLGCEAWDYFCAQQGDVGHTLCWLRARLGNGALLMNPHSGTVQTAEDWTANGFTPANAELTEVVSDGAGGWVEA